MFAARHPHVCRFAVLYQTLGYHSCSALALNLRSIFTGCCAGYGSKDLAEADRARQQPQVNRAQHLAVVQNGTASTTMSHVEICCTSVFVTATDAVLMLCPDGVMVKFTE